MKYRINKFLSRAGVSSRRQADELIKEGRISINGEIICSVGTMVDYPSDLVSFDGEKVVLEDENVCIALHKPVGYICSNKDPKGRPLLKELFPIDYKDKLMSVGRLDFDTEGLIVLTNNGDLAHRMMHPKYELSKEYLVLLNKPLKDSDMLSIKNGKIVLEDGPLSKVKLSVGDSRKVLWKIVVHEGRNRFVRRIFETVGYEVLSLKRIAVGPIKLAELPLARYRYLSKGEMDGLAKILKGF